MHCDALTLDWCFYGQLETDRSPTVLWSLGHARQYSAENHLYETKTGEAKEGQAYEAEAVLAERALAPFPGALAAGLVFFVCAR